jgi:hypothetical protein
MRTAFSQRNSAFSAAVHAEARQAIYTALWPGATWTVLHQSGTPLDLLCAVDECVRVCPSPSLGLSLRAPIEFTIQFRYRREDAGYRDRRDVTITEWNLDSGEPSELHKLYAHYFVYGWFDERAQRITAVQVVNVPRMMSALVKGDLGNASPWRRPGGDQSFRAFKISDLAAAGALELDFPDGLDRGHTGREWRSRPRAA